MKRLALLLACALLASAAQAEPPDGEGASGPLGDESAPKPKPKPRPKAKPKPKAIAPAPKLPEGPIPYAQLQNAPAAKTDAHLAPVAVPVAPVTHVLPPPPTPPPVIALAPVPEPVAPPEALPLSPSVTHDLRCETQVVGPNNKLISRGQFYLEVALSDVFPEDTARFKMVMADPRHQSLLKDTACETLDCRVTISAHYYDLYNARTKRGAQLRVTLDRHTGAYLARRTDGKLPLGGSTLIKEGPGAYEEGYCTLQKRPEKLF